MPLLNYHRHIVSESDQFETDRVEPFEPTSSNHQLVAYDPSAGDDIILIGSQATGGQSFYGRRAVSSRVETIDLVSCRPWECPRVETGTDLEQLLCLCFEALHHGSCRHHRGQLLFISYLSASQHEFHRHSATVRTTNLWPPIRSPHSSDHTTRPPARDSVQAQRRYITFRCFPSGSE